MTLELRNGTHWFVSWRPEHPLSSSRLVASADQSQLQQQERALDETVTQSPPDPAIGTPAPVPDLIDEPGL